MKIKHRQGFALLLLSLLLPLFSNAQSVKETERARIIEYETGKIPIQNPQLFLQDQFKLNPAFKLKMKTDHDNGRIRRYQIVYNGLEVFNKEVIIHAKNQHLKRIITTDLEDFKIESDQNNFTEKAVLEILAKEMEDKQPILESGSHEPYLRQLYYPSANKSNSFTLAYEVSIVTKEHRQYLVYVDANTGVLLAMDEISMNCNSPGTAVTSYSGTQQIITSLTSANDYILEDCTRGAGIRTRQSNGNTDFHDNDNHWDDYTTANELDRGALDAHWGVEQSFDFFKNGWDVDITGTQTYKCNVSNSLLEWNNAFYRPNPNSVNIGMRVVDLVPVGYISAPDIVGHEVTHGVIRYSANLQYQNESGSLNEAYADILGTVIQGQNATLNWTMGEDIFFIRSLANPNMFNHPDTYLGQFYYTGGNQSQLVHTNSGVINHWFYLLSEGGFGVNDNGDAFDLQGIGVEASTGLIMEVLLGYLSFNSSFYDFRDYAIAVATEAYGPCSEEVISVIDAFYAVGLGNEFNGSATVSEFGAGPVTNCSAKIRWNDVGAAYYTIYYRVVGTSTWQILDNINTNVGLLTGLSGNTTYEYYVTNPCAAPAEINPQQFTTDDVCPVVPSINIDELTVCYGVFSWNDVGGQSYKFFLRPIGVSYFTQYPAVNTNSINIFGLAQGLTYECYVVTTCSNQCESEASSLFIFEVPSCAPNNTATVTNISSCNAVIEWTPIAEQEYDIIYRFHLSSGPTAWSTASTTDGLGLKEITNFPAGAAQLEFYLRATCSTHLCGVFSESDPVLVDIPLPNPAVVCSVPINPEINVESVFGFLRVSAKWDVPADFDFFQIRYKYSPSGSWSSIRNTNIPYYFMGSTAGNFDCIEVEVRTACTCDAPDTYSDWVATDLCFDCEPPEISFSDICSTSASMRIDPLPATKRIEWRYKAATDPDWIDGPTLLKNITHYPYDFMDLLPNTAYIVEARSLCGIYPYERSEYASSEFRTDDVCLAPSNFEGEAINASTVQLSWDASSNLVYYTLEYRAANSNVWGGGNMVTNSATITGLDLEDGYYFRLKVKCNSCDESDWTEEIFLFYDDCPNVTFATCADEIVAGAEACTFYYQENPCSNGGFSGYVWLLDQGGNIIQDYTLDWNDDGSPDPNPYYYSNPWMQNCSDVPVSISNEAFDCREVYYFNPDCCGSYPPILECGSRNEAGWDIHYNQVCGVSSYIFSVSCLTSNGVFEEYEVPAGASPEGIFTVPVGDLFCDDIVVTVISRCESGATSPRSNCIILNHRLGFCTSDDDCEWYEGPRFDGSGDEANNNRNASQMLLYPNPTTNGEFYVQLAPEMSKTSEVILLDIYDLNGKLIVQHSLDTGHATHRIKADLIAGMYLVAFKNLEGSILDTRRLVMEQTQD